VLGFKALISLAIDDDASWVQQVEDKEEDPPPNHTTFTSTSASTCTSMQDNDTATQMIDDLLQSVTQAMKEDKENKESNEEEMKEEEDKHNKQNSHHKHHHHHHKKHHHHRHKTTHDATTTNIEILAERYAQALEQRDEAMRREQQAQELLAQYMMKQKPSDFGTVDTSALQLPPVAVTSPRTTTSSKEIEAEGGQSEVGSGGRLFCFICYVIKNEKLKATRRCLECRQYFCETCDSTVHLDDFGVKSTKHFRLNASSSHSSSSSQQQQQQLLPSLSIPSSSSSSLSSNCTSTAGKKTPVVLTREEQNEMKELNELIQEYIRTQQPVEGLPVGTEKEKSHGILLRSHVNIKLMLRYFGNARVAQVSRETRRKNSVKN
jgi:hypothetical protein